MLNMEPTKSQLDCAMRSVEEQMAALSLPPRDYRPEIQAAAVKHLQERYGSAQRRCWQLAGQLAEAHKENESLARGLAVVSLVLLVVTAVLLRELLRG